MSARSTKLMKLKINDDTYEIDFGMIPGNWYDDQVEYVYKEVIVPYFQRNESHITVCRNVVDILGMLGRIRYETVRHGQLNVRDRVLCVGNKEYHERDEI